MPLDRDRPLPYGVWRHFQSGNVPKAINAKLRASTKGQPKPLLSARSERTTLANAWADAQMSRAKWMTVVGAIAGILVLILFLSPVYFGAMANWRARHANYPAVLKACREMIAKKDSYRGQRPDLPADAGVYLDFTTGPIDPAIPEVIRGLKPAYVVIESNAVLVVFLGGFSHLGYQAYAEGSQGGGTEKLIDGLWLIHE